METLGFFLDAAKRADSCQNILQMLYFSVFGIYNDNLKNDLYFSKFIMRKML